MPSVHMLHGTRLHSPGLGMQDYDERNFLIMPGSVHYADMIKYKVAERRKRLQRGLPVRPRRTDPPDG